MNLESQRIPLKEKIGYSLGDAAANFYFQMYIVFMMYFYTDVFGLAAGTVGTIFLFSRIWDAVNDPMMAAIADRTNTRWGKYRPWVLFAAFPLALFGVLTFTTPNFGIVGKIIWACFTYNFLMMSYTANNVPYSALMGVMTGDSIERTALSSARFIAANMAMLAIQGFALPLVGKLGKGNDALGFMLTMIVFSSLALLFLIITFLSSKERIKPAPGQKTSIKQDLFDLAKNRPWVAMFIMTVFVFIYWSMKGSIGIYYTKYFVDHNSLRRFLEFFPFLRRGAALDVVKTGFTFFSVSGVLAQLIGIMCSKFLAVRFGKRDVFRVCLFLSGCSTVVFMFLSKDAILLQFVFSILIQLFYGPTVPLLWAMVADIADFTEWKTNRRATAMTFATILFALKLGLSLGGALAGWLLSLYGYVPDAQQTATALKGIRYLVSLYPAIMFFIGVVALLFYEIDRKIEIKMEEELLERRKHYKYE
ncbi:MAG: MFS transporter [candidate division WOR-3 bacterium]